MEEVADDPVALADADHAFHAELVAASGSPRLLRMADALLVETRMCLAALQDTAPPADALLAEHRELRDAVRDGDAERLAVVLEEHMADAVERILAPRAAAPSFTPATPPSIAAASSPPAVLPPAHDACAGQSPKSADSQWHVATLPGLQRPIR